MLRRAFHKICGIPIVNSAFLAVPPSLFPKLTQALFLACLSTPLTAANPITMAQASLLSPVDRLLMESLVSGVARIDPQDFQFHSAVAPSFSSFVPATGETPAQNANNSFMSTEAGQSHESYPYLLLTLGLILLAFRPANPTAGRP